MNDNKSSGQFPIPGIALVVLALGVLVFSDNPFNPTRPEAPQKITSTAEDVLARLWQDPFEAIERHRKDMHSGKISKPAVLKTSTLAEYTKYQDQLHRVCSFSNENETEILLSTSAHSIKELRCQILRDIEVDSHIADLHVLAVMVSGGPYAENREHRIRSRYAVVSGLSNAGYIPKDAEHIGYIDFSGICKKGLRENDEKLIKSCDWPATIPFEWFEPKEAPDHKHSEQNPQSKKDKNFAKNILVLWLDDEEIAQAKPLSMLDRLWFGLIPGLRERYSMDKKEVCIKFDVLGPAGSTTLVKMYREGDKASRNDGYRLSKKCQEKTFRIISPRATIDNEAIANILKIPEDKLVKDWPKIYRTIPTDKKLVENLLCELMRRGVNPYSKDSNFLTFKDDKSDKIKDKKIIKDKNLEMSHCRDYPINNLNKNDKQDHIVLIGEWDTVYSRNFNRLFNVLIKDLSVSINNNSNKNEPVEQNHTDTVSWLHSYNYFRGIDGSIGHNKNKDKKESKDDKKKAFRRPVGANQLDYLRRLGDQLTDLSQSLIEEDKGVIRAIGIVGSDTYDKLLILQALRSRFPNVIFFTTDLDARMLHNEENKWARNLVVASGYGLVPDDSGFQGLAFRDGYQTSLYLSTQNAVLLNETVLNNHTQAKIFEIGNTKAIDYSHNKKVSKQLYTNNMILYLGMSVLLLFLLIYQTSNNTRLYIFITALVIYAVIIWLIIIRPYETSEFNAMLSGTSIWPSVIIRMFAAVLAVVFILLTLTALKNNSLTIIKENELSDSKHKSIADQLRDCCDINLKIRQNIWMSVLTFGNKLIDSIKGFYGIRFFSKSDIENRNLEQPSIWSHIFLTSWGWRYRKNEEARIDELFYQYMHIAKTRWWLPRVTILTIIYVLMSRLFIISFPTLPFTPFSDEISARSNFYVLWAGLIPYIFLIFLVVDVTRLYARFVELLIKCKVKWSESVLTKCREDYGVSEDVAVEKLKLDLIVRRSRAVDVLIFLPFFVLSLMILSRSNYFDRWFMPLSLAGVILLGAIIALSSAIRLRRTGKNARQVAIENLTKEYHKQCHEENKPDTTVKNMAERIEALIEEIKQINSGPFAPITRHPIVTAVAMPFGGVGGLYLIDYMAGL